MYENQFLDSYVDFVQYIKQVVYQQGQGFQYYVVYDVVGGEEGEQQCQYCGGQCFGEDDGQGDVDLCKVIVEWLVLEVVLDEYLCQVVVNLLQVGGQLFVVDVELQKKLDVIEQVGQCYQFDVVQVVFLDLIELFMLLLVGGEIWLYVLDVYFFFFSIYRCR